MKEIKAVHEKIEKLVSIIKPLDGKESIKASEFRPFSDAFFELTQQWLKLKSKIEDREWLDQLPPEKRFGEFIK